jgi:Cys-rich protein (TIGR01571 family)
MATWSSGLLACLEDKPSAIDTLCCYPCQLGHQFGAINGNPGSMSMIHCLASAIGFFECCACMIRRQISDKYSLEEGAIASCCIAYICPWCSICQTHRELKYQNAGPGGICISAAAVAGGAAGGALGGALPGGASDTLAENKTLAENGELKSKNGKFKLCMQGDGNVVVYDGNTATFATDTHNHGGSHPFRLIMQGDNNLVCYDSGNSPVWASNTCNSGTGVAKLVMQDDGNAVIYDGNNNALWCTRTEGGRSPYWGAGHRLV